MFDVVVVGAGSAGCALAGRLTGRTVLLLEAGPADLPAELRDAASLAATQPGHPWNWAHPAALRTGTPHRVPRGRGLGGSSAINGANWIRVTPADADGWGIPGWSWAELLPHYLASETDELGGPLHGSAGPIPVRRPSGALLHPAAERFLATAGRLGFPLEPDKNAGGPPGAGLVPSNSVDGVRVNAAMAYLGQGWPTRGPGCSARPTDGAPSAGGGDSAGRVDRGVADPSRLVGGVGGPPTRPGLTIRADTPAARVLFDCGRAVGVELVDGTRIEAGEVVLCAGAVGTPRLLMRSGIGPADELRAAGVDVVHDLPGVGRGWSDHPAVFLPFADTDPPAHPHAPGSQVALNLDAGADPAGDVEVLLFVRPFQPGGDLHLMCALQQPDSRGTITLDSIDYHYLRTEHDRRRLRHAIRTGAELLRAGLGSRTAPAGDVLGNDRALDGWIAAHLTTSVHLCGSAAMGSVVDAELRVLGVAGLRVADTSVLPVVPRRGPAATAVAIGEKAAALLSG